jgi:hypothetical protein
MADPLLSSPSILYSEKASSPFLLKGYFWKDIIAMTLDFDF